MSLRKINFMLLINIYLNYMIGVYFIVLFYYFILVNDLKKKIYVGQDYY